MSQNNQSNQGPQELQIKKDIEIKFFRLLPPSLNAINLPLSGLYNDIDNIEDPDNPLQNKFSNFNISSNGRMNIENLLSLSPYFGKVFCKESLEGLIILTNTSEYEVTLKKLDVSLTIDDKPETRTKRQKKSLDIKLPKEGVLLGKKEVYSLKFSSQLDCVSKYSIFIDLKVRSSTYDYQYYKTKKKNVIKETGKDYIITDGCVEILIYKKLTFDVNYPFKAIEKFHNYQMNTCFIEMKIINNTIYPLTLIDLYLTPKSNQNNRLPMVDNLMELSKNQCQYIFEKNKSEESEKNLSPSEYLTLQTEEETSVLFKISDPTIFFNEEKYILFIKWLNLFDAKEKIYSYEFSNALNTYNDNYKITVVQKPDKNIIKNENFKIVIKLETKNPKKDLMISLSQEALRDNDKSNDREIEIIDIIEKKIELNDKKRENNFVLICKSDVLGNVYLPRLKFLLYEDINSNPSGNVYDALLSFNCVQKK